MQHHQPETDDDDEELPGEAWARGEDPETSHEAADALRHSGNVTLLECAALIGLQRSPGYAGTSEDAAGEVGQRESRYSISPRFKPLRKKGFIEATGEKRKNRSGRNADVYQLTQKGRSYLSSQEGQECWVEYQKKYNLNM